jgi:hypothetical protein
MYASHDITWIRDAAWTGGFELPGAGNFLIFDNGTWCPVFAHSEVLEINPRIFQLEDGELEEMEFGYVNPPLAGYATGGGVGGIGATPPQLSNQVVWNYLSTLPNSFFSSYISGAQRQPNGNTVIMSGATGHMFEVTPTGEVVWEFINPDTGAGVRHTQTDRDGGLAFSTFRCYRYGPDFPGLIGKDLTPMGQLTDFGNEMYHLHNN